MGSASACVDGRSTEARVDAGQLGMWALRGLHVGGVLLVVYAQNRRADALQRLEREGGMEPLLVDTVLTMDRRGALVGSFLVIPSGVTMAWLHGWDDINRPIFWLKMGLLVIFLGLELVAARSLGAWRTAVRAGRPPEPASVPALVAVDRRILPAMYGVLACGIAFGLWRAFAP